MQPKIQKNYTKVQKSITAVNGMRPLLNTLSEINYSILPVFVAAYD